MSGEDIPFWLKQVQFPRERWLQHCGNGSNPFQMLTSSSLNLILNCIIPSPHPLKTYSQKNPETDLTCLWGSLVFGEKDPCRWCGLSVPSFTDEETEEEGGVGAWTPVDSLSLVWVLRLLGIPWAYRFSDPPLIVNLNVSPSCMDRTKLGAVLLSPKMVIYEMFQDAYQHVFVNSLLPIN